MNSPRHRHRVRILSTTRQPSERLLRACAAFGLGVRQHLSPRRDDARSRTVARDLLRRLAPGRIALITGPSGSGKSTALKFMRDELTRRGESCIFARPTPDHDDRAVIDQISGSLGEALATLASAGLADAPLLCRASSELSDGERSRLALARAFASCDGARESTLLIDEFASTLDRITARSICMTLRRWSLRKKRENARIRIIAATAHTDVVPWLTPDITMQLE